MVFDREQRSRGHKNYFDSDDDGSELFFEKSHFHSLRVTYNYVQLQFDAITCNIVQLHAILCNLVQFHAMLCNCVLFLSKACGHGFFNLVHLHIITSA